MLQRQTQTARQQQRADPQMLLTNRLLQMAVLELQQCVAQELDDNPALEDTREDGLCGACSDPVRRCAACPYWTGGPSLATRASESELSPEKPAPSDERLPDPLAGIEARETLQDFLERQLRAALSPAQLRIGAYLSACIDADGYLRADLHDTAAALGVKLIDVEAVLAVLHGLEPSGVGARTLQECLLLQARSWNGDEPPHPLAVRLLEVGWKELTAGRMDLIARRLRQPACQVEAAAEWVRKHLSPYPGRQFASGNVLDAGPDGAPVRPDIIVLVGEDGRMRVELTGEGVPPARVSRYYADLGERMRAQPQSFSEPERAHIQDYLWRAQRFLKALEGRSTLLRQIAERLIDEQEAFFRSEREEDILALTQSHLASFLQVHESTVSRAVADKFAQLPSGRTIPLTLLFDRSISYRTLVAGVVAGEDPRSPYSDQEIADILRRRGIRIARRTVMKYREEMNILSSRQRCRIAG